ncbi:LuxR C-terminal-related transcriptional regulator [Arenivirga flava]|uniref:DNA-binding response regulator n=1 Tax=Arenivirga flava TaxID=1930060 RepID=A0AA37XC89_9MICO|nr:LuxR C-terminal-related transcriptional regulator [Arenivirga flava]GMA29761.1 DNA-binding response regulator [Arenivirga flava]
MVGADVVTTDAAPVTLSLLDDHEVLLDSFTSWVREHATDFDLVLSASTWSQFVHSAAFPTQLVILDFQLREQVSIEARVRTCRAAGAKVIVLSGLDSQEARDRALDAGAALFLSKSMPLAEVMDAARRLMGRAGRTRAVAPADEPAEAPLHRPRLSQGEQSALTLYALGNSTQEVADQLNVQYETAKTYLRRVREKYAKAGRPASRKAELIRRAAEDGYLR